MGIKIGEEEEDEDDEEKDADNDETDSDDDEDDRENGDEDFLLNVAPRMKFVGFEHPTTVEIKNKKK